MNEFHRALEDARGIALVKVLLLTTILIALATFGANSTRIETRIAQNDLLSKKALAVAEAGVHETFQRIIADSDPTYTNELNGGWPTGGTGGGLSAIGSPQTRTENGTSVSYRFRAFGGGSNDGYWVRVEDNFDEPGGVNQDGADLDSRIWIVSRGIVGPAERVLKVAVRQTQYFGDGLFGDESVVLHGNSTVDSYNSQVAPCCSTPPEENGDIGSNGNVTLDGSNVYDYGHVTAGGTVFLNGASPDNITQGYTDYAPPVYFPPVTRPAFCETFPSNYTGITGGSYNPVTGTLTKQGGGGNTITLAGGDYCFSSITLNGQTELRIDNSNTLPVRIWLVGSGQTRLEGGGVVNESGIPSNLQIFATADCAGISLQGGSSAAMAIYAPDVPFSITGGSDFFGAIVANSIDIGSSGTQVHYDAALASLGGFGGQLADWHEVRN